MKSLVFFLLLTTAALMNAAVYVLPEDRLPPAGTWEAAGVPGGIPTNRTTLIDVTQVPYNADNTGATDAKAAIQAAVNAATAGQVVYLPAGTYRVDSQISISKSNITIRGAGVATIIDSHLTGRSIFSSDGSGWGSYVNITSGYTKGSTSLTLADASSFAVGAYVELTEGNDTTLPVMATNWYSKIHRQLCRIDNKAGNTITIYPGLYWTMQASLTPQTRANPYFIGGVGIEDMLLDSTNASVNQTAAISFGSIYSSWIKNVRSKKAGYHFFFDKIFQCEVRHCYFDDAQTHASNGSGIIIYQTSALLVTDNIIYRCFPSIELNAGSSGNVFSYNYIADTIAGYDPGPYIEGAGLDDNHSPHPAYNLYEGNVCGMFQADGYFGSSSSATAFRNWFHGTNPTTTDNWKCVDLCRFTRNYNIVGNILGKTGYTWVKKMTTIVGYSQHNIYRFGYPNMGNNNFSGTVQPSQGSNWVQALTGPNGTGPGPDAFQEKDLDVEPTTLLKGNYNYADNAIPTAESLAGQTLPTSLYLTGKPAFFGSLAWPAFDSSNPGTPSIDQIPAGYRYLHGTEVPTGSAPLITSSVTTNITGTVGSAYSYQIVAAGATSFGASELPTGLSINTSSGLVSGIPTQAGIYTLTLSATNSSGTGTATMTLTINLPDTTAPSIPTNLTGTAASTTQINLTWTASTDNVGVIGYRIYRDGALAGTTNSNSYTDTGLTPGTAYSYQVAAFDAAGNISGLSAAVIAVPHDETSTNFGDWVSGNFTPAEQLDPLISGSSADPSGCGVSNLLRYACGLPARGPVASPLNVSLVENSAQQYLALTFPRKGFAPDLEYIVQSSSDLAIWIDLPIVHPGYPKTITVRDLVPVSGQTRRFLRLRVTTP